MLRPTPGDPWGVEQHHWNTGAEEKPTVEPRWAKQQTKKHAYIISSPMSLKGSGELKKSLWKVLVKPQPFIDLLILDIINQFNFGHGVLIYYISYRRPESFQVANLEYL